MKTVEPQGDPKMAEKNQDEEARLDELVALNFKLTERERRDFKVWCASKGMTQTEAFKMGFKLLKSKEDNHE